LAAPNTSGRPPFAAKAIKAKEFLIDGEAVSCDDTGLAVFERIRHRRNDSNVSCMRSTFWH
jgi:ATP-dependent DNA ligase